MNDALQAPVWILVTALLAGIGWACARRAFPGDRCPVLVVHVVVMSWSSLAAVALLLGRAGVLSRGWLLSSVCAVSALVIVAVAWRPTRPSLRGSAHVPQGRSICTLGWGVLAAWLAARVALDGIFEFPIDWDTLAYHLPLVDHWLREGTLYAPDCAFWYVPGNNELWALWAVGPFSGDFLWPLNNLPAIMLLAAAALELGRCFGLYHTLAHLAAMAIVATRVTWQQAVSMENDIGVAALFLATLLYGVRFARGGRWADIVLASMSFGLLCGVKYYALGYAGAAGLVVIGLVARRAGLGAAARAFALGLLGFLVLGSYWYLRNAVVTGTPLYPKGFTEATDLWGKMRPESATTTLAGSGRPEVWPLLAKAVTHQAGPCHIAGVALLPVTLVWLAVLLMRRRAVERRKKLRVWLVPLVLLSALVYVRTPNVVDTVPGTMNMLRSQYHPVRFGLSFFSLGIFTLAAASDDAVRALRRARFWLSVARDKALDRWKRCSFWKLALVFRVASCGVLAAWLGGVTYQAVHHSRRDVTLGHVLLALDVFILGVLAVLIARWAITWKRPLVWAGVVAGLVLGSCGICHLARRWQRDFISHYDTYFFRAPLLATFASLQSGHERICICYDRYYPFFGSRRQYDVCRPLWVPDFEAFCRYLWQGGVTLVVAPQRQTSLRPRYGAVKQWASGNPEMFELVHQDARFIVVRVERKRLEQTLRKRWKLEGR